MAKKKNVFIHKTAVVDKGAKIGKGTKIWHFSHICGKTKIGIHCKIGQNVYIANNVIIGNNVKLQNNISIYEGAILEDNVFCGPSMVFTNIFNPRSLYPRNEPEYFKKTLLKYGVSIGANATLICGVTLGRHSFVGAGSVVTRDIPDYGLVYGNPARLKGWMCECGQKLEFVKNKGEAMCQECDKKYIKKGIRVKECAA